MGKVTNQYLKNFFKHLIAVILGNYLESTLYMYISKDISPDDESRSLKHKMNNEIDTVILIITLGFWLQIPKFLCK